MLQLSDLPELVSDYADGDINWMIAYAALLRLLGRHEVAEIMPHLSAELAAKLDASLREDFPDREQAERIVWIDNAGGEPPDREQIVESVLRWLSSASGGPSGR